MRENALVSFRVYIEVEDDSRSVVVGADIRESSALTLVVIRRVLRGRRTRGRPHRCDAMTQTTRRVTNTFRYEKRHSKSDVYDDDDVISNAPRVLLFSLHFERDLFSSSQKSGGFALVFVFVFLLLVRNFGRTDFHRVER
jgi:hypothetical protein